MASVKGTALLRAPIIQGYQLMHTWGASLNYLYCNFDDNHRRGIGRATTFSDVTGQADITNFKGSVATKLAYDNIDTWTAVYVRTVNSNGITHTEKMKKTDAGGMPDAIVDIWKTGIEYWGYTWSSSFSMPNRVYIEHNNPHD
ncbi:hypothetical protein SDC9_123614 [bioreactor metagenome]|uniref:Uncharacterized protein n=1 Tax=bioreactor metagenome TaxID=1076179 RepID=A0A645CI40_9ZZZZ